MFLKLFTPILLLLGTPLQGSEPLKVVVGSQNQAKVAAVCETLLGYSCFEQAEVIGFEAESGVNEQPLSLEETVKGAKNRAEAAFKNGTFGIGLESGLMQVPETDFEYMDVCICSVFDGKQHHIGMSCGFRLPKAVSDLIFSKGFDLNQAMQACGLTSNPKLGSSEGAIGILTQGRINRKDHCRLALTTALISIENSHYFFATPNCPPIASN